MKFKLFEANLFSMHLNSQRAIYMSVGKYYLCSFGVGILGLLSQHAQLKTLIHVKRCLKWKIERLSSVPKFPTDYNKNIIIILII